MAQSGHQCFFHLAKEMFGRQQIPLGQQNPVGQQYPDGQQFPDGQQYPRAGVWQSAVFLQPQNAKFHIHEARPIVCIGDGPRRVRYVQFLKCEHFNTFNCPAGGTIIDGVVSLNGLHNHG
jgi:hypothetical protein